MTEKLMTADEVNARLRAQDKPVESMPDGIDYFDDAPDAALQAEPATLERLTLLATQARELELTVAELSAKLAEEQSKYDKIMRDRIPTIMEELGMMEFKLVDGSVVSWKEDVKCGITEENKPTAFSWLEDNDYDAIIKTRVGADFGKGEMEAARQLLALIEANGVSASLDRSVHNATLKSFVKERLEAGDNIPIATFGIFPFKMAKIKAPAAKKPRK